MKPFHRYEVTDDSTNVSLFTLTTTKQLSSKDGVLRDIAKAIYKEIDVSQQITDAQAGKFNRGVK